MVDGLTGSIKEEAAEIEVDIDNRGGETEEFLTCRGAPVAAYAKLSELRTIVFFEVDSLPFF